MDYQQEELRFASTPSTSSDLRIPQDFTLQSLLLVYDYEHYQYVEKQNIQQINRIEDINLGARFQLGLGVSYNTTNEDYYLAFKHNYQHFFQFRDNQLFNIKANANGLLKAGSIENSFLSLNAAYFFNYKPRQQVYVAFKEAKTIKPFSQSFLELGGDLGLRGYPSHYQSGNHLQMITVEHRYYGAREWFALAYAGFAFFYDAGQIWGETPRAQTPSGIHQDIGFGLRLSNTRLSGREGGGHNIVHIDIASPLNGDETLDKFQLLFSVRRSF